MYEKETNYIDTLFIYTLWYEFSNNFVAQNDFGKKKIHKKFTHLDHSYHKYTSVYWVDERYFLRFQETKLI